jgi:hypothetical protein
MTSTSEISSWQKAKDVALIGFVVLASGALVKILYDVADLKTSVAVYQVEATRLRERVERLESVIFPASKTLEGRR